MGNNKIKMITLISILMFTASGCIFDKFEIYKARGAFVFNRSEPAISKSRKKFIYRHHKKISVDLK